MIVVLLMAIILGLSIPGYRQYAQRAGRVDATSALLRIAAAQERWYLENGTYATDAELPVAPPNGLGFTGGTSERGYYNLEITVSDALEFEIQATTVPGEKQADDTRCATLTLDQTGQRTSAPDGIETCWR